MSRRPIGQKPQWGMRACSSPPETGLWVSDARCLRGKAVEFVGIPGCGKTTLAEVLISHARRDNCPPRWHTLESLTAHRLPIQSRLYSAAAGMARLAFWADFDAKVRRGFYEYQLLPRLKLEFALRHFDLLTQMVEHTEGAEHPNGTEYIHDWLEGFAVSTIARSVLQRDEVYVVDEGMAHRSAACLIRGRSDEMALDLAVECVRAFWPIHLLIHVQTPIQQSLAWMERRGRVPPILDTHGPGLRNRVLQRFADLADIFAAELRKKGTRVLVVENDGARSVEEVCEELWPAIQGHLRAREPSTFGNDEVD